MNTEQTRRAWVKAVLEGRLATAAWLEPDLPPADKSGVVSVPAGRRERHAVSGEIGSRE